MFTLLCFRLGLMGKSIERACHVAPRPLGKPPTLTILFRREGFGGDDCQERAKIGFSDEELLLFVLPWPRTLTSWAIPHCARHHGSVVPTRHSVHWHPSYYNETHLAKAIVVRRSLRNEQTCRVYLQRPLVRKIISWRAPKRAPRQRWRAHGQPGVLGRGPASLLFSTWMSRVSN